MILVVTCVNVYRTWPSKGRPAVSHARHCGSLFSFGIFAQNNRGTCGFLFLLHMLLRRARAPEKLVEWVRAEFAPSQNRKWRYQFKKHFANRNARPWKTTEDDDPSSAVNATAMDA